MTFTLQPVQVGNGVDEEGMLVFDGRQRLVAVLPHLGEQYGGVSGHWYLEAGFGRLGGLTFATLNEAQDWLSRRFAR